MSSSLEKQLRRVIEGEVRSDPATLCAYSVDASIFEVKPLIVVTPKSKHDIQEVLRLSGIFNVPVVARGAATGITGGCLGKGLILDLSKYLKKILQVNIEEKYVICEPGVVQDQLNAVLSPSGYRLGPDTSTGNRATIGGMLANNSAGAHSLLYGKMSDHILEVEAALSGGDLVLLKEMPPSELKRLIDTPTRLGQITKEIDRIRTVNKEAIGKGFPKIPRRVSGYNLDELTKSEALNLAKLIAGSEGTLGIATTIKLQISPKLEKTALCIVHFHQMIEGMKAIPHMLGLHPVSLEMIDNHILEAARLSPSACNRLKWLQGSPEAVFVAELQGPDISGKTALFEKEMSSSGIGYACTILTNPQDIQQVWDVRKAGLGLLLSKRTYSRAIAFLEDLSIPPEHLASFMTTFRAYLETHGKEAGIYGHVGAGCMHIRPYMDLRSPIEVALMEQMMSDVSSMVLDHGGALSGEHGDGLIRTWLNKKMFGPVLYRAFCEVKKAFDPDNLLNPGKVVHGSLPLEELRLSPATDIHIINTFQDFSPEGGFSLAADLCNGNGQCRKSEGLMCPSFQATGDELHTTRARAQALRAVINGRWKIEDFTSDKVGGVLDLCLECKGCKTDCPSHVDMAKMKSEFLYQYQEVNGYALRNTLFGNIGTLYKYSQPFAELINAAARQPFFKKAAGLIGISSERTLPALARQRFSTGSRTYVSEEKEPVILFNDTFMEFNQPQVGEAAFHLLSLLGYRVIVPPWNCCGRPLISKGLLRQARKKAELLIGLLYPYASAGIPIVGLEPSCILTIADDLPSIVRTETRGQALTVAKQCTTFDQFIHRHLQGGQLPFPLDSPGKTIKVHGHCHQKALVGMTPTMEVIRAIPGIEVSEIQSGCCGMAGSFGYEKEHYSLSMKIGSLHLFPEIASTPEDVLIIANGFSCRSQIKHGTKKTAVHLAEVLYSAVKLRDGCGRNQGF